MFEPWVFTYKYATLESQFRLQLIFGLQNRVQAHKSQDENTTKLGVSVEAFQSGGFMLLLIYFYLTRTPLQSCSLSHKFTLLINSFFF